MTLAAPTPIGAVETVATPSRPAGRRTKAPYLFILPFFAIFLAFGAYPLISSVRLSLTTWHGAGDPRYIGLKNYTYLLNSPEWWHSLGVTGLMWLMIVPLQVLLALVLAVLLTDPKLRGRGLFRTAFIAPLVTPLIAMAQVWIIVFDRDYGAVNQVLGKVGISGPDWLGSTDWSRPTIALLVLWKSTGFAVIVMLAGLQSISPQVYEAASLDGASWWQTLTRITAPMMRRTIAFYVVIDTLGIFQMFAEPLVITKGGPDSATTTSGVYLYGFITNLDLGTGAAASFLLVLVVLILSGISMKVLSTKRESR